jgi:hypothetical protein
VLAVKKKYGQETWRRGFNQAGASSYDNVYWDTYYCHSSCGFAVEVFIGKGLRGYEARGRLVVPCMEFGCFLELIAQI